DHVGSAGDERFGAGLHRLARDVAEHVIATRDLEHVVEEADAAAGVEIANGAWLAAEDEQRARTRFTGDSRAYGVELSADRGDELRRGVVRVGPRAERGDRRQDVGESAMHERELRDGGAVHLSGEVVLRSVQDDEVRAEGKDPLDVGVQQRADAREPVDLGRVVIEAADRHDAWSCAECEQNLSGRRYNGNYSSWPNLHADRPNREQKQQ